MAIFKCKMCGGELNIIEGSTVCECPYCGTKQTVSNTNDEKIIRLYDRANYSRRENEYDKAMGIYEMILAEDKKDAEAYWGIVLCKYGIEYVEDPRNHKRIPTINRAQYTSILKDKDYLSALQYADGYQKDIYEAEANVIDVIQRDILEVSSKEEPYDIFICYKETDSWGNRTRDSVYAQDLYSALTKEGYRVFFSKISLEHKLGQQYEPIIFAALHSARIMLVVGTSKDNFESAWVKNEWSRFFSLVKEDNTKTIIPCYKDITPYDLPKEFSYLQSQDMGKIGYIQDVIYGIKKIIIQEQADIQRTPQPEKNSNKKPIIALSVIILFLIGLISLLLILNNGREMQVAPSSNITNQEGNNINENEETESNNVNATSKNTGACSNGHLVEIGKCERCGEVVQNEDSEKLGDLCNRIITEENAILSKYQEFILQNMSNANGTVPEETAENFKNSWSNVESMYISVKEISSKYSNLSDMTDAANECLKTLPSKYITSGYTVQGFVDLATLHSNDYTEFADTLALLYS